MFEKWSFGKGIWGENIYEFGMSCKMGSGSSIDCGYDFYIERMYMIIEFQYVFLI